MDNMAPGQNWHFKPTDAKGAFRVRYNCDEKAQNGPRTRLSALESNRYYIYIYICDELLVDFYDLM